MQKVLGVQVPARVLAHILASKFRRSPVPAVAEEPLTPAVLEALLRHVVQVCAPPRRAAETRSPNLHPPLDRRSKSLSSACRRATSSTSSCSCSRVSSGA